MELTRETIKKTVEGFFGEHEEKELVVTVSLDSSNKKAICNFHIASEIYEIVEDSTKTELIISNYTSPLVSLIPDDVTIRYEEVTRCESLLLEQVKQKMILWLMFWRLHLRMVQFWNWDFCVFSVI